MLSGVAPFAAKAQAAIATHVNLELNILGALKATGLRTFCR
jgi:hypothetical protein